LSTSAIARERRHTLYFLNEIKAFAPVFLDTEIDVSRVQNHRAAARQEGRRLSLVSYVLHATARVLADHPEANAGIRGRVRPRVARYESVSGKLVLDKTLNGRRIVVSAILPDLDRANLDEIQRQVDHYRDGDPASMDEYAGMRALHRLPWPLGPAAYRRTVRPLGRRQEFMGSFAVSSLGHRPVDGFHSVGGATITIGVGQVIDRPVVRDGQIVSAPVMRLNLSFDHRVIDGAEAADVLADIKSSLEDHAGDPPQPKSPLGKELSRNHLPL
jgi:pyruvate/2-oxoglutarate dehydrogenase complex dihydrolipoamide acyltransferase (E2) component